MAAFFVEDADMPEDANERAITHRIAVYLEAELRKNNCELSVDCEYNRLGLEPKRVRRLGHDSTRQSVYPDVIVHRRGSAGPNLLVAEFKRLAVNEADRAHDWHKLREYVSELNYRHAFLVLIGKDLEGSQILPARDSHGQVCIPNGTGRVEATP